MARVSRERKGGTVRQWWFQMIERAVIGIAEEDEVVGGQPQLGGGGERPRFGGAPRWSGRRRASDGMRAGEEKGDFVVVAHGEEADPDGQVEGERFLDEAAGGEGFVVGMRGQDQQAVLVAQLERRRRGAATAGAARPASRRAASARTWSGAAAMSNPSGLSLS